MLDISGKRPGPVLGQGNRDQCQGQGPGPKTRDQIQSWVRDEGPMDQGPGSRDQGRERNKVLEGSPGRDGDKKTETGTGDWERTG